jgi:chromosome transmission fidelity protein 4
LSCGTDGDFRSWNGIDDDDPKSQCVGEFANCLWQYGDRLFISTDVNTVQAYTYPDLGRDGIEFRFTAPVTSIKANETVITITNFFSNFQFVQKNS